MERPDIFQAVLVLSNGKKIAVDKIISSDEKTDQANLQLSEKQNSQLEIADSYKKGDDLRERIGARVSLDRKSANLI